jgi:hypothetical protein
MGNALTIYIVKEHDSNILCPIFVKYRCFHLNPILATIELATIENDDLNFE